MVGIIPFVCLYVDAICDHNDIRIMVIGRYLRSARLPYFKYEALAENQRSLFILERVALDWSSLVVGAILLAFGLIYAIASRAGADWILVGITAGSGTIGLSLTI